MRTSRQPAHNIILYGNELHCYCTTFTGVYQERHSSHCSWHLSEMKNWKKLKISHTSDFIPLHVGFGSMSDVGLGLDIKHWDKTSCRSWIHYSVRYEKEQIADKTHFVTYRMEHRQCHWHLHTGLKSRFLSSMQTNVPSKPDLLV